MVGLKVSRLRSIDDPVHGVANMDPFAICSS
jgi:hypothetical protein